MADQHVNEPTTDGVVVREAFSAARDLLAGAEADAVRIRGEADRYVRQREAEAELLVAKARRVLAAAEIHAAVLRDPAPAAPIADLVAPTQRAADPVLDLDAEPLVADQWPMPARRSVLAMSPPPTGAADGLDGILASAIGRAVDRAFDADV